MIRHSIHLPRGYRLDLNFVKRRGFGVHSEPLVPTLLTLRSFKSGNKVSRFFRHIVEKINIKKFLGANIALMLISSSVYTTKAGAVDTIPDVVKAQSPLVFTTQQTQMKYPTNPVKITQRFSFFHPGIDLDGITGDSITPIASGVVVDIQRQKVGYGNSIYINHGGDLVTLYAHLSKINVVIGQQVNSDTVIGLMGATGKAFGDHLHLEIYQSGKRINPLTLLQN